MTARMNKNRNVESDELTNKKTSNKSISCEYITDSAMKVSCFQPWIWFPCRPPGSWGSWRYSHGLPQQPGKEQWPHSIIKDTVIHTLNPTMIRFPPVPHTYTIIPHIHIRIFLRNLYTRIFPIFPNVCNKDVNSASWESKCEYSSDLKN